MIHSDRNTSTNIGSAPWSWEAVASYVENEKESVAVGVSASPTGEDEVLNPEKRHS